MDDEGIKQLTKLLEDDLTERYGPILGSSKLIQVLGFPTPAAFRQAVTRKTIPVPIFRIPSRRGHFALARDVASWLAKQRQSALVSDTKDSGRDTMGP